MPVSSVRPGLLQETFQVVFEGEAFVLLSTFTCVCLQCHGTILSIECICKPPSQCNVRGVRCEGAQGKLFPKEAVALHFENASWDTSSAKPKDAPYTAHLRRPEEAALNIEAPGRTGMRESGTNIFRLPGI